MHSSNFVRLFHRQSFALYGICVTETWLKPFIFNNEILPTNYVVYRNDRGGKGGGVLLAVRSKMSSTLIYSPTHLKLLTATLNHTKVITICLLYIPPNPDHKYISDLIEYLNSLCHTENLIMLGDLNFSDVNWDSLSGTSFISSSLCEEFFNLNLSQSVTEPIHNKGNLLDVVLTNAPELIDKSLCDSFITI